MPLDSRWLRSEPKPQKRTWTPKPGYTLVPYEPEVGKGGDSDYGPFDPYGYGPQPDILDTEAQAKLQAPAWTPPQDNSTYGSFDPPGYRDNSPPQSQEAVQPQESTDWWNPQRALKSVGGAAGGAYDTVEQLPVLGGLAKAQRAFGVGLQQYGGEALNQFGQAAKDFVTDPMLERNRASNVAINGPAPRRQDFVTPTLNALNIIPQAAGAGINAVAGQPWTSPEGKPMGSGDIAANFIDPLPGAGLVAGAMGFSRGAKAAENLAEHANPAIRAVQNMLNEAERPSPPSMNKLEDWRRSLVQHLTDRGVHLSKAQEMAQQALDNGKLPEHLMPAELSRLQADPVAEQHVVEQLKPIAQEAGDLYDHLAQVLVHSDNLNTARSAGIKARDEVLSSRERPQLSHELIVDTKRAQADMDRLETRLAEVNDKVHNPAPTTTAAAHMANIELADKLGLDLNKAQDRVGTLLKRAQVIEVAGEQRIRHEAAAAQADAESGRLFSGGVNVADSEGALQALEQELGPQRWGQVQQLAQRSWDYADQLRDRMVEAGVWTQEKADFFKQNFPHYVPTNIMDFIEEDAGRGLGKKTLSVTDDLVQAASIKGTEKAREDPLVALERATYQTERVARRNETFNAFLEVRDAVPQLRETIREVPTAGWDALKNLPPEEQAIRRAEHKAGERLLKDPDYVALRGFKDGQVVTYAMPKGLAEAIQGEPTQLMKNALGDFARAFGQFFTRSATTRNPAFLVGNAAIDTPAYLIRESARSGQGPLAAGGAAVDLAKAYFDLFKPGSGISKGEFTGDAARMLKSGAGQFGFYSGTRSQSRMRARDLQRKGFWDIKSPQEMARLIFDIGTLKPVEELGSRVEMAPRLAAFRRAERRGLGPVRSAIAARDVTLDFARGGDMVKVLNQFTPFINAGVQGAVTPYRALRENPVGVMMTAAGLVGIPTMAAEAWNRGHNPDGTYDPQRARDYADVAQYDTDPGAIIMLPNAAPTNSEGIRKPEYVKIRLREWAWAAIAAREVAARIGGASPSGWQELLGQVVQQTSPVQGPSDFLPPWLSTPIELTANRAFFSNRDIATTGANEKASSFSQAAAGPLTSLRQTISGDPYSKVQPSQIDYALRGMGAGAAGLALGASDIVAKKPQPEAAGATAAPIVGGVARRVMGNATGQRLFDLRDKMLPPEMMQNLRDAGIDKPPDPPPTIIGLATGSETKLKPDQQEEYARIYQVIFNSLYGKMPPDAQHDKAALEEILGQARNQTSAIFQSTLTPEIIKSQTTFKNPGDKAQQDLALDLEADLHDTKRFPKYMNPETRKVWGDPAKWAQWDQEAVSKRRDGKPLSQGILDQIRISKQTAEAMKDGRLFSVRYDTNPKSDTYGAVLAVDVKDPRYEAWNRHFGVYAGIPEAFYQSYRNGNIPRYVDPLSGRQVNPAQSDMYDRWLTLYRDTPTGSALKDALRPRALVAQKWLVPDWSKKMFGIDKAELEAESGATAQRQAEFVAQPSR